MRNLSLSRYALSVCVAATLFVGCGGPQAQSWNAALPLQSSAKGSELMKRAAGGAFTASYTGTYGTQCGAGICVSSYHGTGSGTFIHHSRLKGKLVSDLSGCGGPFTFRNRKHPSDAFTVYVSFNDVTCQGTANVYGQRRQR